jgi:hypothetical protein
MDELSDFSDPETHVLYDAFRGASGEGGRWLQWDEPAPNGGPTATHRYGQTPASDCSQRSAAASRTQVR